MGYNKAMIKIHICKQDPCPVRDREASEILLNGFNTMYIPDKDEYVVTSVEKMEVKIPGNTIIGVTF